MVCFEAKYDAKPLPKLLEEGKKRENSSSLLLFKKRKEGSFGCLSFCYGFFEMVMESSIMLKLSLIRGNMSLKLWGYTLSCGFLKGKSLCVGKEGILWLYWRE